jgi:hypothetical protein
VRALTKTYNYQQRLAHLTLAKAHIELWAGEVLDCADDSLMKSIRGEQKDMFGYSSGRKQYLFSNILKWSVYQLIVTSHSVVVFVSDSKEHQRSLMASGIFLVNMEDQPGQEHLKTAHDKLDYLQRHYGTSAQTTSMLARVKYLLGYNVVEVEDLLIEAINSSTEHDRVKDKASAFTLLGWFYEKCYRIDEARRCYTRAMESCHYDYRSKRAKYRLGVLNEQAKQTESLA